MIDVRISISNILTESRLIDLYTGMKWKHCFKINGLVVLDFKICNGANKISMKYLDHNTQWRFFVYPFY